MRVSAGAFRSLSVGPRLFVVGVLEDVVDAGLVDVAEAVARRVLPPGCDPRRVVDEAGQLQPFAELLFLELRAIAARPGWMTSMRRTEALAAIAFAGF